MSTQQTNLEWACYYATRFHWKVFPVHHPIFSPTTDDVTCSCGKNHHEPKDIGKHPATAHGFHDATTDIEQIQMWWTTDPEYNIGLNCGDSGLVVIDCDPGWQDSATITDTTCQTRTGRPGGLHKIYKSAGINSTAGALPHIDIRATGGYIILPPSLHVSGHQYQWDKSGDPEPLPESLRQLLALDTARTTTTTSNNGEPIPVGKRDDTLFRLASAARNRSATESEILALLKATNERCEEPLGEQQLVKIARSAGKYEPALTTEQLADSIGAEPLGESPPLPRPPRPPFPIECLPGAIRNYVEYMSDKYGWDYEAYSLAALVTVAGTIGNRLRISPSQAELDEGNTPQPAAIWLNIVAPTGSGKTPLIDAATSPLHPALIVTDTTIPALIFKLSQSAVDGVVVKPNECKQILQSMGEYNKHHSADESRWQNAWDGVHIYYNRMDVKKTFSVERPVVNLLGGMTFNDWHKTVNNNRAGIFNGLFPRFVALAPNVKIVPATKGRPSTAIQVVAYKQLLKDIEQWFFTVTTDTLLLSPPAYDIYQQYVYDLKIRKNSGEELQAACFGKDEFKLLRFALVLACAEQRATIDDDILTRAIQLTDWLSQENIRCLLSALSGAPNVTTSQYQSAVIDYLKRHHSATKRDIQRNCNRISKSLNGEELDALLLEMVHAGLIQQADGKYSLPPNKTTEPTITTVDTSRTFSAVDIDATFSNTGEITQ